MTTKHTIQGAESLSDRDLLALALGNEVASDKLLTAYGTLANLSHVPPAELSSVIGSRRAARLMAALELPRRYHQLHRGQKLQNSNEVFAALASIFKDAQEERFMVLPLDAKNRLICPPVTISIGSLISTVVHPREVFSRLIQLKAVSTILAHNHPSSHDPTPSEEDIQLTHRLKTTGDIVGIKVLDHIVIGGDSYYSFTDNNIC
jgi:DNA repair protein RadC